MLQVTIGMIHSSLIGRAAPVAVNSGQEAARARINYPHAVMERQLPCAAKPGAAISRSARDKAEQGAGPDRIPPDTVYLSRRTPRVRISSVAAKKPCK